MEKIITETIVIPAAQNEIHTITALEIIRLINNRVNVPNINLIGADKVIINFEDRNRKNTVWKWPKLLLTTFLLLIGSGLAIMYFHADVNMHKVHGVLYYMITGHNNSRPLLISIPYSIGIGMGIMVFFDVFHIGRKKNKPGPLELEVYRYEKDINSYLIDEKQQSGAQ
jgi:stage V sporulation protein AA